MNRIRYRPSAELEPACGALFSTQKSQHFMYQSKKKPPATRCVAGGTTTNLQTQDKLDRVLGGIRIFRVRH